MAAGSATRTLTLKFTGDTKALATASKDVAAKSDEIGASGEKAQGKWSSMFSKIGPLATAGIALAADKIYEFGKESVKAFESAQEGQAKWAAQIARVPGITEEATKALEGQAKALAEHTKFSEESNLAAQAQLATFGLTADQIQKLTPQIQDLATKTGTDLPTAAGAVGKAFLGNTKALKAVGVNFKATGDQAKDFATISADLQKNVGGLADVAGGTAAGKMAILKNQFEEVQISVGSKLVPVLTFLATWLLKIVQYGQQNASWLVPLIALVASLVIGFKTLTLAMAAFDVVTDANPIAAIAIAIIALIAAIVLLWKNSQTFRDIVMKAWADIKEAAFIAFLPIIALFDVYKAEVEAVIAVVMFLYSNVILPVFHAIAAVVGAAIGSVVSSFDTARGAVLAIGGAFSTMYSTVVRWIDAAVSYITGLPGRIAALAGSMLKAGASLAEGFYNGLKSIVADVSSAVVNSVANAINTIVIRPINTAITWINSKLIANANKIPGINIPTIPPIPQLAKGAVVSSAMLAMIGEGPGREIVTPETLLRKIVAEGGGDTYVTINVPESSNPAEVGRIIVSHIRSFQRASGASVIVT